MPNYTLYASRATFRAALRALSPADRREALRLLGVIQMDPSVDNRHKIAVLLPPVVFYAYVTDRLWIAYHVVNDRVTALNVGLARTSQPMPW